MLSPNESIDDLFNISALVVVTITPRFQLGHFSLRENSNNTVISALMTRTWLRLSPLRYFGVALQSLLLNILFHRCESSSVEKGSYLRLKGPCFSQNFTCGGQRQVYGLCCHSCPTLQLLLFKSLIRPSHSRVRKVV